MKQFFKNPWVLAACGAVALVVAATAYVMFEDSKAAPANPPAVPPAGK